MAVINIRVEDSVKKNAEAIYNELGLNMSVAINLFLKKCISENGIPFELKIPNAQTLKAIQEVEDIVAGKIKTKTYDTVEEAFKDVLGDEY